jgi:Arc/MetJ-type ribon-helix-helix transcriptional regulator
MSTINISLPPEQVTFIDKLVSAYGFANRSEFVRSLVRLLVHQPQLIEQSATFPFTVAKEKNIDRIVAGFKRTKKYSSAFLKDLKEGLKTSDYFRK